MQGSERLVLEGADGMLRCGAVRLVFTEVPFARLCEGGALFDEPWRLPEAYGYSLYAIFLDPELRDTPTPGG